MADKPTISVRGAGHASMAPDQTVVKFKLTALKKKYADSVNDIQTRVEALRSELEHIGVARERVKTARFHVVTEHDWKGEHKNRKQSFIGWRSSHAMNLELPIDRELTNRVLMAIESADVDSEIEINFEVTDKASLRSMVLADATRSASRNAEVMAKAAGCTLGAPVSISYDWTEIRHGTLHMARGIRGGATAGPDLEPDDIQSQEWVTVVYELER